MKNLLVVLSFLFAALYSSAQTPIVGQGTATVFTLQPWVSQRAHTSDSVQMNATLVSGKLVQSIVWTQVPTGVPTVAINAKTTYPSGATVATSSFWLTGLAPGLYVFKAVGLDQSGATGSVVDSITVIPDAVCPICPVCPVIPPPRTVAGAQVNLFGIWVTLPAGSLKLTYSDKATGTY